jgi:hypothetical protein
MKQIFLLVSFVFLSVGLSAQCTKSAASCCKNKATSSAKACAGDSKVASAYMEADAAMEASNGNITKRTCSTSGTASYYQKSVCSQSGNVSWEEVQYDASTKSFTKVASASMEKDAQGKVTETKSCSKSAGKACCKDKKGVQ